VGTATAQRGQASSGVIHVPAGSDAGYDIPVTVVNGAKPGPVLALVSGAHGTEYASIIALEKLLPALSPAQISGSVIVVPLVNLASFEQKVPHVNPVDNKSMNRYYPGNPQGTQTDRALYQITKQVVEQADYLVDLHGGDIDENLRPYSYWAPTGKADQDRVSKEMALAFGLDTIIISTGRPTDPNASRYLETTASLRGKPSITAEAGRWARVDTDDVDALVNGCLNLMGYLKMLARPVHPVEHPVWIEKVLTVTSDVGGIFYPTVDRGSYVEKGGRIGYVTDYAGRTVFEARSPEAGEVLYICSVPTMTKGGTVANIGTIASREP
jgi:predicted deacylase